MSNIDIPPPFDAAWFQALLGFFIGIVLGSFITMLSYRLPRKLAISLPPSACPSCHTPLKARDLVPVFSWLMTHGKCRTCGTKIGARYIMIEIVAGLTCAAVFVAIGPQLLLIAAVVLIVAVITAVTIKIENK